MSKGEHRLGALTVESVQIMAAWVNVAPLGKCFGEEEPNTIP